MIKYSAQEILDLLILEYTPSELEVELNIDLGDFYYGLETFISNHYDELCDMITRHEKEGRWDD